MLDMDNWTQVLTVFLSGLVAIVLAIRGFKLGRGRCVFKSDKNLYHVFLKREVKPAVPHRKILRYVKDPSSMKEIHVSQIHRHF
jgi:hypothetical protein